MNQYDVFGNLLTEKAVKKIEGGSVQINDGIYCFYPDFFSEQESNNYLVKLRTEIEWKQESMFMYGKKVNFPRLTAWYGDNDKPYSFSGITLQPHLWTMDILAIKAKIEPISNAIFNSVLLNLYRDGNDSISWHTDAERELGVNPIIASVNFGETRSFQMRHIRTKEKLSIELSHGSLLIMEGELQHFWQHQVPKTNKKVNDRINLTFRVIK
jgi:alkylated DNA repair dioxygenase AlkB